MHASTQTGAKDRGTESETEKHVSLLYYIIIYRFVSVVTALIEAVPKPMVAGCLQLHVLPRFAGCAARCHHVVMCPLIITAL